MILHRLAVAALLFSLGCLTPGGAAAQEKPKPDPRAPKGFDKATVDAWAKRGFSSGWVGVAVQRSPGHSDWKVVTPADPKTLDGVLPAFVIDRQFLARRPLTLDNLPPVDVPFGLVLAPGPAPDELKHLDGVKNLTALVVAEAELTDDSLKHLAGLKGLTVLSVGRNYRKVTAEGLKHLAVLTNLTHLDLSFHDVAGDGLNHLAGLKKLTHLNLHGNGNFAGEGLKHFPALTHLSLAATKVGDAALAQLAEMKNLTRLDLSYNAGGLTDGGLKHLAGLTNLTGLDLVSTDVRAPALAHLAGLKKLTALALPHVDDETVRALR